MDRTHPQHLTPAEETWAPPGPDLEAHMRQGLRRLAKSVVVITTQQEGRRYAMAATAVSELSMAPPSLLVCVNGSASIYPTLKQGNDFCINILASSHRALAVSCSGAIKGEARFESGVWIDTALGPPRLADAQASFVCRNVSCTPHGTHGVFIGNVLEAHLDGAVDPLVYVDGDYVKIGAAL